MASASEAWASLLGGATTSPSMAFLPGAQHRRCSHYPPPVFSVSCKSRRNRNGSGRRQKLDKVSQGKLPLKEKFRPKVEEVSNVQNGTPSDISSCEEQIVDGGNTNTTAFTVADGAPRVNGDDQVPSKQVKQLVGTIKNAEKSKARTHALEDLDKILAEKKMLQGQVKSLEMKLEEADEHITVAKQGEEYIKVLEMELQKLKSEISFKEAEVDKYHVHANGRKVVDPEDPAFSLGNFSSLSEELDNLRKENILLRVNMELLNTKLDNAKQTDGHARLLEKERISLMGSVKEVESKLAAAQEDVLGLSTVKSECKDLQEKVESLQVSLDSATGQANQAAKILEQNDELQRKIVMLEASLADAKEDKFSLEKTKQANEALQQKIKMLENHIQLPDQEINSHIHLYHASVKDFQDTLNDIKEKNKKKSSREAADDMPWEFWSQLLLMVDAWSLEKRISANNASLLRDMAWKRDVRIRDAYFTSKGKCDNDVVATFLKLASSRTSLNIVHIAAEMAPIAKVGGLGDAVSGLCKALQRKGNLVEVIVPKYDCLQTTHINDLRMLDAVIESFVDGQLFKNKIWVGTVEGLPVYFIEPHHPAKFFQRGQVYGQHDDFKRFSYFSRAALEFLDQAGKRPDIIHCHDWHTAFIAPLYWELYAPKGFNSARICFTCHNFEYQGTAPASELASCGLNVNQLQRADRMQDNCSHDRVNLVKGATVFSNIVTTVSPTYAKEVQTAEGGQGLHSTLNLHSKKFVGILNGIDTDTWNPSRDAFLRFQYSADEFHRKIENKDAIRKYIKLSSANPSQPLVGCITRLVPQKGVHLIRHAIYRTLELGGQFILLGSSPVHHIQREFEDIANKFESHPHARLVLKYDEALSHSLYAALDMLVIPSIFEPCGLTQMIAMRYGTVPIVRRTGGLNDSVFDVDDDTIPVQLKNGFTFLSADEQGLSDALERAFNLYTKSPERWWRLAQKNMRTDFSWDSSSSHYEDLYQKAVARARARAAV